MATFKQWVLLGTTLILSYQAHVVESSMYVDYVTCSTDEDCRNEKNTECIDSICDCVEGAIKLSDNQCLEGEDMPTARKVGKAESAEKVKVGKGELPSDAIPDWALYASIFFGFIGMILIGIAIAKRSDRQKENAKKRDNSGALPLNNSKDIEAPKEASKTFLTVPKIKEIQPKLSAVSTQPAALNVLNTAT